MFPAAVPMDHSVSLSSSGVPVMAICLTRDRGTRKSRNSPCRKGNCFRWRQVRSSRYPISAQRAMTVAKAAPATPILGKPKLP